LPELQTKIRPLTGIRVDGNDQSIERKLRKKPIQDFRNSNGIVPSTDAAWSRPSYLLDEPIEIQISAHASGEPKQLRLAPEHAATTNSQVAPSNTAQIAQIIAAYGPERIESQWWSGPTLRRNYFRIVLETGQWWWIYEDMNTRRWYLHGMFD
jgi:protein ImuB